MRNSPLSKVNEIGHLVTSEFQFNYNHGCPALEVELGRQQRIQMVFRHLIISEQPPKPLSIRFQPYSQFSPHFQFVHFCRSIQSLLNVNVFSSNLSFEGLYVPLRSKILTQQLIRILILRNQMCISRNKPCCQ